MQFDSNRTIQNVVHWAEKRYLGVSLVRNYAYEDKVRKFKAGTLYLPFDSTENCDLVVFTVANDEYVLKIRDSEIAHTNCYLCSD